MERRRWERRRDNRADHLAAVLRKSWYRLRLSVRHPARVPTWDAIVLTAASPEQAALYDWQLRRAKRMGRIAPSTLTLAVPDPDGARIGSGAATIHAISTLARHLLHEVSCPLLILLPILFFRFFSFFVFFLMDPLEQMLVGFSRFQILNYDLVRLMC